MAENSFGEWFETLLENKKSRKNIELLKNNQNYIKENNSKHILFISDVNGLGDAIMLRGVLDSFIQDGYIITLVTKSYHIKAYSGLDINRIIEWKKDIAVLKESSFNMIVGHHLNDNTYKLLLNTKASKKYIINTKETLVDVITINSKKTARNIWDIYNNFLENFGYKYKLLDYEVNSDFSLEKYNLSQKTYIAIHIGSGSLCKNWGVENFLKLSNELNKLNLNHVFIAGPFEKDLLEKYQIDNIISDLDFLELVEIIRNAKLVICHGTSILHLSVTVNTPTVSINSTYDYNFWHPYKDMPSYKEKHIALTSICSTNCNKYRRLIDFAFGINKNGCPILKREIKVENILKVICD
jgi:ADP-heptose:LPS heptosyltransferase